MKVERANEVVVVKLTFTEGEFSQFKEKLDEMLSRIEGEMEPGIMMEFYRKLSDLESNDL